MALKFAAKFWAGDESKDDGGHLISRFCSPQKDGTVYDKGNDPIRWEKFRAYAGQDTNVMVPILARMEWLAENGGESLQDHWPYIRCVDRMNERGTPVDAESARIANTLLFKESDKVKTQITKKYGFAPGSVKKVSEALGLPNCQKDTLEAFLLTDPPPLTRKLAEARLLTAGAASKKLIPIIARTDGGDSRVYDCFVYHGAKTRRLTSLGVQLHNLVRERSSESFFKALNGKKRYSGNIFRDVRSNIRGFIKAEKGNTLVTADYNAIECRVSAWLAGEDWLLEAFRDGKDPYLIMASAIYGQSITDKSDPRRQMGKVVELGAQYGLGAQGLLNQCDARGIKMDLGEAQRVIRIYRELHPNICETWRECEHAFKALIFAPIGERITVKKIVFERGEYFIKLIRPSGFGQYFFNPRVVGGQWPDGATRDDLVYVGRGQGGVMHRLTTYGGDLFQSAVQGIATGDYVLEGMLAAEDAGFPLVLNVHDEIAAEVAELCEDEAVNLISELEQVLCVNVYWATDLPITAEGWPRSQPRFTK